MKYEMIFGDEKLFDGAPNDAEAVSCVDGFNKLYYKSKSGSVFISSPSCLQWQEREAFIVHCMSAMRRIIQEPKRWTIEDQKAGRLPDVGAKFKNLFTKKTMEVLFKDEKVIIALNMVDSLAINFTHKQFFDCNKPLETPEEKAERLRSEWVELAFDNMMRKEGLHSTECLDRVKCHFGSAYDALISGTLSAPTKGGE